MDLGEEIFIDDDADVLDIIEYGFRRRRYERTDFFHDMDNLSFFRRFRLTKPTVLSVLERVEEGLEFENDLNNSVSPINQLLLTLRFYASAGHQTAIGDFIGVHQSTASRIIAKVSSLIASLRPEYIKMHTPAEMIRNQTSFYHISRFPRVGGCIDGTHIRIQSPGGEDAEVFRNRKGYFSVNVQIVNSADLKIADIVSRWPGSAQDATIVNNSRICGRFATGEFQNSILLGDSGYLLKPYLLTPVHNPQTRGEILYNEAHIRTRNSIERLFGIWKRRFPILSLSIVVATAVLHNIAQEMGEDVPPPAEDIDINALNYLIAQGDIPNIRHEEPLQNREFNNQHNFRQQLINTFFAVL